MTSESSSEGSVKDEAAAAALEEEATAVEAEPSAADVEEPVASSTPESGNSGEALNQVGQEEASCSGSPMILRKRKYSQITGRRAIHSPIPRNKTTTTTPKVTVHQLPGSPKIASPVYASRRREVLSITPRTVMRRRPLYPRRSPRLAEKRKSEEQGRSIASPPKRKRYNTDLQVENPIGEESSRAAGRQVDLPPSSNGRRYSGHRVKASSEESEPNVANVMNTGVDEQTTTNVHSKPSFPKGRKTSTPSSESKSNERTLNQEKPILESDFQSPEGSREEEEDKCDDVEDDDADGEEPDVKDSQLSEAAEPPKWGCRIM